MSLSKKIESEIQKWRVKQVVLQTRIDKMDVEIKKLQDCLKIMIKISEAEGIEDEQR